MPMTVAVIDLGTNTFNLLIANLKDGQFSRIYNNRIAVKLGEGAINKGFIAEIPFQRGLQAVREFKSVILQHPVQHILAFGTSAIRNASNGADFCQAVCEQTGIKPIIIKGETEAELIYLGNKKAVKLGDYPSIIMDIGGGSTEFIIANQDQILWKHSFELGAARMLEEFQPEDPIRPETISALHAHFESQLTLLRENAAIHRPVELIGSSGAFDSFVDIIGEKYQTSLLHPEQTEYPIAMEHYRKVSAEVVASTVAERLQLKGLTPMRIDMIVLSFLFVDYIIDALQLNTIKASTYSLKEGVLDKLYRQGIDSFYS